MNAVSPKLTPYDVVPYPSDAFPQTDPRRISCLARMFGLDVASPRRARVLELGCASGGNILPLAARMPGSEFVGVDFSNVQIGEARRLMLNQGLGNVVFHQMDLADIGADFGSFDYIICHGVYSWVPVATQAAILRIAHDNLSQNGVAFISYNTYPGWKSREILRDSMQFHTRALPYGAQQVAHARGMLDFMRKVSAPASTFSRLLEDQGALIKDAPDNYLLHEYLESDNRPCYFHQFNARIEAAGLTYLGDTDTFMMFAENFGAETQQALMNETQGNQILIEQYLDFCTNRSFRQTLVVKASHQASINRQIKPESMKQFCYRGLITGVTGDMADPASQLMFATRRGNQLRAADSFTKAALFSLLEHQPGSVDFKGWLSAIATKLGGSDPQRADALAILITQMVVGGHIDMFDEPFVSGKAETGKPKADDFARRQLAAGVVSIATPFHEPQRLNIVETALLPKLDGTRGPGALIAHLEAEVAAGRLQFHKDGQPITARKDIAEQARQHFHANIASLGQKALLAH